MSASIITSKQIQDYIINNYKTKTNTEMGLELNISKYEVSAKATWLQRKGIINLDKSKGTLTKIVKEVKPKKERVANVTNFNNCVIENLNIYNEEVKEKKQGVYTNGEGVNKKEAKIKMQEHIIGSNIQGHIGTLTNLYIDMETAIYDAMPNCSFTAVEKELRVFDQMRRKFKKCGLPIKCVHGYFSDILYGKDKNTYAHLIMDYCGDLPTIAKELEYTIDNDLVGVGGIIALTTNRTNRRGKGEMWDFITSLSNDKTINKDRDTRSNTEIQNERFLYSILGKNYKIIEVFNYRDDYPMTLTIIKRIK
jgi:hypothetical protein